MQKPEAPGLTLGALGRIFALGSKNVLIRTVFRPSPRSLTDRPELPGGDGQLSCHSAADRAAETGPQWYRRTANNPTASRLPRCVNSLFRSLLGATA
jgi:hypothetical protein